MPILYEDLVLMRVAGVGDARVGDGCFPPPALVQSGVHSVSYQVSSVPHVPHCLGSHCDNVNVHCMAVCSKHCPGDFFCTQDKPRASITAQPSPLLLNMSHIPHQSVGFLSLLNGSKVFKFTIPNWNTCPLPLDPCPLTLV